MNAHSDLLMPPDGYYWIYNPVRYASTGGYGLVKELAGGHVPHTGRTTILPTIETTAPEDL